MIRTVRCHYNKLEEYCNKIGREHIISITSCWGEQYGEHFFTLVYDTPNLILMIMAFTQSEPVDVYNMTVEEQIKSEREILGR